MMMVVLVRWLCWLMVLVVWCCGVVVVLSGVGWWIEVL